MILSGGDLPLYVLISSVACPLIHVVYLLIRRKPVTGRAVYERVFTGASVPQSLFLALSPLDPSLLTDLIKKPELLVPTGVIALIFALGGLFNWRE